MIYISHANKFILLCIESNLFSNVKEIHRFVVLCCLFVLLTLSLLTFLWGKNPAVFVFLQLCSFSLFCPVGFAYGAGSSMHRASLYRREVRVGGGLVFERRSTCLLACRCAVLWRVGSRPRQTERRMCAGCRWGLGCWTWEAFVFETIRKQPKTQKAVRKCESLTRQELCEGPVRVFLENFFTYVMASGFVGLSECIIYILRTH